MIEDVDLTPYKLRRHDFEQIDSSAISVRDENNEE